jgi:hypothetical protein
MTGKNKVKPLMTDNGTVAKEQYVIHAVLLKQREGEEMTNWTNNGIRTMQQLFNGEIEQWENGNTLITLHLDKKEWCYVVFVKTGNTIKSYAFDGLLQAREFINKVRSNPEGCEQIYQYLCEE